MKKIKVQGMEIGVRERDKDAVSLGLYGEFNDLLAHCLSVEARPQGKSPRCRSAMR